VNFEFLINWHGYVVT